jgi:hypothetical protein
MLLIPARMSRLLLLTAIGAALSGVGCGGDQQMFADNRAALVSLNETTILIADGWLSGALSATYARTALDASARLLADRRAELATTLQPLATREGQTLSQSEERLSRVLASLADAIRIQDAEAARDHLHSLQAEPSRP